MLGRFEDHNYAWQSALFYQDNDPHLRRLAAQKYSFDYPFDRLFDARTAGVYLLSGGRQLGKTTSLKKLILKLLQRGVPAQAIFYLPCDLLIDRFELYKTIKEFLLSSKEYLSAEQPHAFLLIDEATYVDQWELGLKAILDEGYAEQLVCVVSASDKILLEDAVTRLAGRRGKANQVDYSIHPLSFREHLSLFNVTDFTYEELKPRFESYLLCGGYLTAINEFEASGTVSLSTFKTYQDWVVGDMIRLGKSREILFQVLFAVIKAYGSQVSYQGLTEHTDGVSKDTLSNYIEILERLGVLAPQPAYDQNSKRGAPKKNKKFHFLDPFITLAMAGLVSTEFEAIPAPDLSHQVESICFSHIRRAQPCYYFKGSGEIDIVWVRNGTPFFREVKWRHSIRTQDLAQISLYQNAEILIKEASPSQINAIPCLPVQIFLAREEWRL
jgi:predicted AAA+ superfamily ATPase